MICGSLRRGRCLLAAQKRSGGGGRVGLPFARQPLRPLLVGSSASRPDIVCGGFVCTRILRGFPVCVIRCFGWGLFGLYAAAVACGAIRVGYGTGLSARLRFSEETPFTGTPLFTISRVFGRVHGSVQIRRLNLDQAIQVIPNAPGQ